MKMLVESLKECTRKALSPRNRSQSVSQKEVFQRRNMNTSREKNIPVVRQNDTA